MRKNRTDRVTATPVANYPVVEHESINREQTITQKRSQCDAAVLEARGGLRGVVKYHNVALEEERAKDRRAVFSTRQW